MSAFHENAPRPPVPGGEETNAHGPAAAAVAAACGGGGGIRTTPTPRRCAAVADAPGADALDTGVVSAPLGFEPEGRALSSFREGAPPFSANSATAGPGGGSGGGGGGSGSGGSGGSGGCASPPPYLRWARNLHSLLEDPEGVALFRRFLEAEGPAHEDTLNFWFACEGLKKQEDPERTHQLVKVIHRRFFVKTQLAIPEELRREVNRRVKEGALSVGGPGRHVFDSVQAQVERLITETTYPNFLRGDLYLHHVQAMQGGEPCSSGGSSSSSGGGSSSSSGGGGGVIPGGGGPLPPLPEDSELALPLAAAVAIAAASQRGDVMPLTRDSLLATQRRRHELRPRPEAFAGMYLQHGPAPPPHPAYSSYNPVSRQDSELQSLSSDARTESDNLSLTDSSVDGASQAAGGRGRRRQLRQQALGARREARESAAVNAHAHLHHAVIPRTQRLPRDQLRPLSPSAFASLLTHKLEQLKRERDVQEQLHQRLALTHQHGEERVVEPCGGEPCSCGGGGGVMPSRSLPEVIRDKLQVDDDSDQAILDQHVSRVWSDLTPARSPGLVSPRPRSPEGRRSVPSAKVLGSGSSMGSHPSHVMRSSHCPRHAHARKEKDVFSTFSSDSGNVHDFPEGPDLRLHQHHVPKSKSMPLDPQDALKQDSFSSLQGYDPRFRQSRDGCRRSSSKKTLTDLTDSGVSVVSDSAPVAPLTQSKDRVLSWLLESEKSEREGTRHSRVRCQQSATSPGTSRHGRRGAGGASPRSGSLERGLGAAAASMAASLAAAAGTPGGAGGGALGAGAGAALGMGGGSGGGGGGGGATLGASAAQTSAAWAGGLGLGHGLPQQPFVADPCMPPLPMPHTDSQLEEARRRLLEASAAPAAVRAGARHSTGMRPCTHLPLEPLSASAFGAIASGPPTLRRGGGGQGGGGTHGGRQRGPVALDDPPPPPPAESTTVVFSYCDEKFPYRTKIPGRSVTLRQFKEVLPKKGSYRFFFKTECEDLDMRVIQEEVTEDSDILPLWEGKVMAQVKPID